MELDDLQAAWAARDRKLDASLRLNTALLRRSVLGQARWALRRMAFGVVCNVALDAAALLWLGSFLADHVGELRYFAPALALHLGLVASLACGVRQLVLLAQFDEGAPVLALQARLESLRIARLRELKWTLLLAALAWPAFLIVVAKGLAGLDALAFGTTAWWLGNVAVGLAALLAGLWACRRLAERVPHSPRLQKLLRDLSGSNLEAAQARLAALAAYEREAEVHTPTVH